MPSLLACLGDRDTHAAPSQIGFQGLDDTTSMLLLSRTTSCRQLKYIPGNGCEGRFAAEDGMRVAEPVAGQQFVSARPPRAGGYEAAVYEWRDAAALPQRAQQLRTPSLNTQPGRPTALTRVDFLRRRRGPESVVWLQGATRPVSEPPQEPHVPFICYEGACRCLTRRLWQALKGVLARWPMLIVSRTRAGPAGSQASRSMGAAACYVVSSSLHPT
jgi:hypothetical protein